MAQQGIDLTKEQFEEMTKGSFLTQEPYELVFFDDSNSALMIWEEMNNNIVKAGIAVRNDITEHVVYWKKKPCQCLGFIQGKDTKDMQAVALISRKNDDIESPYYVNLMLTMAPVMQQDFIVMMIKTLQDFAKHHDRSVIIPKRYQKFLTQ